MAAIWAVLSWIRIAVTARPSRSPRSERGLAGRNATSLGSESAVFDYGAGTTPEAELVACPPRWRRSQTVAGSRATPGTKANKPSRGDPRPQGPGLNYKACEMAAIWAVLSCAMVMVDMP